MNNPFHDAAHCARKRVNEHLEMQVHAERREQLSRESEPCWLNQSVRAEPISFSLPEPTRVFHVPVFPALHCMLHHVYI